MFQATPIFIHKKLRQIEREVPRIYNDNPYVPRWFPRLAQKFLNWIGCHWLQDWHDTYAVEIQGDSIDRIIRHAMQDVHMSWGQVPEYVLLGYDELKDLESWSRQSYHTMIQVPRQRVTTIFGDVWMEVFGLKVILVPWMKGLVVLPGKTDSLNTIYRKFYFNGQRVHANLESLLCQ